MADISDWYGENTIDWGDSYAESWWGNVNEANSWGIIYPATAEGSIITADTSIFTADQTIYTADGGDGSVVVSPDTTPPVITITGSASISLTVGDSYTDAGATATDNIDGDITSSITTSGTVDTATEGTYTITYSVSDAAGNSATETRTITVSAASSPGTVLATDLHCLAEVNNVDIDFTYSSTTYANGFTEDIAEITTFDGVTATQIRNRTIRLDTATPQVGSFIADFNGNLISDSDTHNTILYGPYAAYATAKYVSISTTSFSLGVVDVHPIYKVEQSNGYLKITEEILS